MNETEVLKKAIPETGAIAFSGGLDSSFIAYLALRKGPHTGYVAGLEGSHDVLWAEKAAGILGLPLKKIVLTEDDVRSAYIEVKRILETDNKVVISFEIPLYFVAKSCKEREIITGQGADELFGGYKRYERMDRRTLEIEIRRDVEKLLITGINRDRKIAEHFGKRLITPYLDRTFLALMMEKSALERKGGGRKDMLRRMARYAGLPEELWKKEKKAAQYGSGVMKVLKK